MKQFIFVYTLFFLFWMPQLPAVSYPEGVREKPLCLEHMHDDPMTVFQQWYRCACRAEGAFNTSKMTLATSSKEGRPSACMMMLKGVDDQGFCFYGDLRSMKFQHLEQNPYASLVFYWPATQRQVIVTGKVTALSPEVVERNFASRKKEVQAASSISHQGKPLQSRDELTTAHQDVLREYKTCPIPQPDHWVGYKLIPEKIEFWQAGHHNLHSIVEYTKNDGSWKKQFLHP